MRIEGRVPAQARSWPSRSARLPGQAAFRTGLMISWSVIEQRAYPIRIGAVAAGLYRVLDGHRPGRRARSCEPSPNCGTRPAGG